MKRFDNNRDFDTVTENNSRFEPDAGKKKLWKIRSIKNNFFSISYIIPNN